MATADFLPQCTKIPRFSADINLRTFHFDVLQDCGHLSVSGYSVKEKATFIDLFKITDIRHGGNKPLLENSKPFYSIEPPSAGSDNRRTTCLLDGTHFVTCSINMLQTYNTDTNSAEKEVKLVGKPRCMARSKESIYIALSSSQVAVFDFDLQRKKTIKLMGVNFLDWPLDIAVYQENLFVCLNMGAVNKYNNYGNLELRYQPANVDHNVALSVTVSETNDLLYVLWGVGSYLGRVQFNSGRLIVAYSPSDGHFRAAFSVATDSWKIKICDKDDRLFLVTSRSGEVFAYHVGNIFDLDKTLGSLELVLEKGECHKLARYFKIPPEKSNAIFSSNSSSGSLLGYLREIKKIAEDDMKSFLAACCHEGIMKSAEVLIHFQHFRYQKVKSQLEAATDAEEKEEEKEENEEEGD